MKKNSSFIIFSDDFVFTAAMQRILCINFTDCTIYTYTSYSQQQELENIKVDIIIVDDSVDGMPSLELISFLRLEKKLPHPIYYLSIAGQVEKRKALMTGVNFFFEKPFRPQELIKHLKQTIAHTLSYTL